MNEIETIIEQAKAFAAQHMPAEVLHQALPFGLICLALGIFISVLGAKMARLGVSGLFAIGGAALGVFFARQTDFPAIICSLVGALALGVVGYHTMRMWVGVVAAIVFALVALGVFGYQRVMPYMAEFQPSPTGALVSGDTTSFTVPSPDEQQAYRDRDPQQYAKQLWAFATEKDANLERNTKAVALLAVVAGLSLGVAAARWALILSTSLVGTVLVTSGMGALAHAYAPASYQSLQERPTFLGVGLGAFLLTSLIVQTLLTRTASKEKGKAKTKS
ncbi:MAG: hypothetical protein PVI86_12740 [Phycisphaerae bacterium]|jgi:hypothetical protein